MDCQCHRSLPLLRPPVADEQVTPIDVIGFSFGGWIAAEMAVNNPTQFRRMALVAPFGIKPTEGYITDMFIVTTAEYLEALSRIRERRSSGRSSRRAPSNSNSGKTRASKAQLAWEPYMHNPSLRAFDGLRRTADTYCVGRQRYDPARSGARLCESHSPRATAGIEGLRPSSGNRTAGKFVRRCSTSEVSARPEKLPCTSAISSNSFTPACPKRKSSTTVASLAFEQVFRPENRRSSLSPLHQRASRGRARRFRYDGPQRASRQSGLHEQVIMIEAAILAYATKARTS